MATTKLKFSMTTDMFGATITLSNAKKTYNEVIAEQFNPSSVFDKMDKTLATGYLFRSPNISVDNWQSTLTSLSAVSEKFNLTASVDQNDDGRAVVTALVRFQDQSDAAMFAWSHTDLWQKWSDTLEAEAKAQAKAKPTKVFVGKDGKLKAKVTVTTLGNIDGT